MKTQFTYRPIGLIFVATLLLTSALSAQTSTRGLELQDYYRFKSDGRLPGPVGSEQSNYLTRR